MNPNDRLSGRRGAVLALVGAALLLAGCGRRSTPKAPEGSRYNRPYPTRESQGLPPEGARPEEETEVEDAPALGPYSPPPPPPPGPVR
ncbi:MAG: hypothetical protein FJX42_01550 [Alphaproteobacteria bacterium]|nr:hypothetical protein [Alphaproteobacteria bacterium]